MESRREFIKKATMLTGAAGFLSMMPESIQKALAIDPAPGSTYLDAEHIVVLMQENRSFDHAYGTLQGVRGFNDPRAIRLPNDNLVWLQTNAFGETHIPFRLNMRETNATWMGSLPHSWTNQVDARNNGLYDRWLIAKAPGDKEYKKMPLTQGYYNREDIPFYYAFADAFTVADQNFCSALAGTTTNRLYLWSGTIRESPSIDSFANVENHHVNSRHEASWKTFPERLEEHGIPWRMYQNELSIETGLTGDQDDWLANFTDNPIEWFKQYNIRYHTKYQDYLADKEKELRVQTEQLQAKLKEKATEEEKKGLDQKLKTLAFIEKERQQWSAENFEKLSQYQKNLHQKAFTTNVNDPDYRNITTVQYHDGDIIREAKAPQGDILHQFRTDVNEGKLPTVSWLVAPKNFSDHPSSPWYGAWYVSETLDILTKNPEVWKKTIFILCYDENDGYFDHVPPFVVPNPNKSNTGKVSKDIDAALEYVTLEQDLSLEGRKDGRESPIGLGYRVPLVIASPWNRGGKVFSEVSDHTSILQFMETFLQHKTGKNIKEENISQWRRTICSDLTASFTPYNGEKIDLPAFVDRAAFMEGIHNAQFKKLPSGYKALTEEEVKQINENPYQSSLMTKQEKGIRPACPLPYEMYANGELMADKSAFSIRLKAGNDIFGKKASGSPFTIYAKNCLNMEDSVRNYAVSAGDELMDEWSLSDFHNGQYRLSVYGPNGFYREFRGSGASEPISISCIYQKDNKGKASGNVVVQLKPSRTSKPIKLQITDNAYHTKGQSKTLTWGSGKTDSKTMVLNLEKDHHWYDFSVQIEGDAHFSQRFAGHVETGKESMTDPLMGQVNS
ncbi:phospholipase C [Dyadobacter jejuensis]|uniref:phospholipase C n=1 Tax=Dyadobacter jejuensis TaxID=1082580 RepID=A0A316ANI4_9BACT|nr:phospholipase C, phosphocholine-specific [Dyadobacter jejuensis]PWJ59051.1 phospholipase C [Dyadobacter jejuensis]